MKVKIDENKLVIIEIRGGVAEILTKSEGVEVNIKNYNDGQFVKYAYTEEIYEADEII